MSEKIQPQTNDTETYLQTPDYLRQYPNIEKYFCPKVETPNSTICVYASSGSLRLGDLIVRSGALNLIALAGHNLRLITNGLNFI